MRYIKAFFTTVCISNMVFSEIFPQQIIPGQKMTAAQKGTIVMRELPPGSPDYFVKKEKKKAPNQERIEVTKKQTTVEEMRKQVFPVQMVTPVTSYPANENNKAEKENPSQIFESPCVGYAGLTQLTSIPPDVSGAVGFDHIFMTLNDRFRIQYKNGTIPPNGEQRQGQQFGFWDPDTTNLFDPKIIYDPYRQRWTFVILQNGGNSGQAQNSSLLIAVSQTSDPMGAWFHWKIDADTENDEWLDYPSVGFNKNWLVVNGNMFPIGQPSASSTRTFIFNINELYSGGNVGYYFFTTTGYFTICPAMTYDPFMNDLWCVTNDDVDDNDLRFFKVSGGPGNPSFTEEGFISVGSNWGRGGNDIGPQAGTTSWINTNDHDVLSAVWRNGSLFTAQTVFIPEAQNPPDYCTIQFVICDPGSTTVHQAIRFSASNTSMYAHPCLTVNANGDIVISCTRFSSGTFPSACVLVRRGGTTGFTEAVFKSGEDWYVNTDITGRNRWGDYTTAMVDPSDDNGVWVASQYSRPKTPGTNTGSWGTWWAKICSGVCLPTITMNTVQLSGTMKKFEASDIVFASGQIDPGANIKLDAGNRVILQPGFRALNGSRLRAFVEGCGGPE